MKVCPNSGEHPKASERFITTAHVVEEWVVDGNGNWMETLKSIETTHPPDEDNEWVCFHCGTVAEKEAADEDRCSVCGVHNSIPCRCGEGA